MMHTHTLRSFSLDRGLKMLENLLVKYLKRILIFTIEQDWQGAGDVLLSDGDTRFMLGTASHENRRSVCRIQ